MKFQFLIKSFSAAFVALLLTFNANAQQEGLSTMKPMSQDAIEASDDVTETEYSKGLNLTPEQKAAFKKANKDYKAKTKAAKNAKKEELQRLRLERIRAHKAALTPEQAKKYDEMVAQKEAKRKAKQAQKEADKAAKKSGKKAGKPAKGKE